MLPRSSNRLLQRPYCFFRSSLDQTIKRDREFAHARSRGVPDGICDRTRRPGNPDLTDALDAEGVHVGIVFLDKDRFDRRDIGIYRNVVLGQICVHRTAGPRIHDGLLMKRERHAPNHSAAELAAHQTRIDDASGSEGADQAADAHLSEFGVDLGKDRAMRMHGMGRGRAHSGRATALTLDFWEASAAEDIGVSFAPALVVATEPALLEEITWRGG
jgi:hypothetical protein